MLIEIGNKQYNVKVADTDERKDVSNTEWHATCESAQYGHRR